jgi:hypothetical protein
MPAIGSLTTVVLEVGFKESGKLLIFWKKFAPWEWIEDLYVNLGLYSLLNELMLIKLNDSISMKIKQNIVMFFTASKMINNNYYIFFLGTHGVLFFESPRCIHLTTCG